MAASRQIGPFELLERLGAGGMGEVFKARDSRLNRFVALKFLPASASDAARERFQREALAIAALNHPHICTLYEVGSEAGRPYLVLELLEGETLKARLRRGALDPEQLLDWSVQISDALDAAHRKGVLHRDLKPDNVWVAPGGHIKVLDFGLARLEGEAAAGDATVLTSPGVAMGTVPYMSPEQARGEVLDARSDVFSFGSVFYEMASGRPAFPAANAADSIAAVLRGEPPKLAAVRPELSPLVSQVAERCLEKDPDLRYQSAADLRGELKRLKRESASAISSGPAPVAPPAKKRRRGWLGPAAGAAALLLAAGSWWAFRPRPPAAPPALHFQQLTFNGHVQDAVISPDGKFLAHVDDSPQGTSLHLLSISSGSDVEIMPPAPGCCQSPSFSPDGGQVFFHEGSALKSVPVLGGTVRTIADPVCSGAGFSPDGSQIAVVTQNLPTERLSVAQADGSQLHTLHQLPDGHGYLSQCWVQAIGAPTHSPSWSPDGRWIAVADFPVNGEGHVSLVDARTGAAHDLGPGLDITAADLNWLPDSSALILTASVPDSAPSQVWELTNPGGKLTQLTTDLQGYAASSLSSAGQVALVHSVPQSSIWVQAQAGGAFQQLPGGGADQDGGNGLSWTPSGDLVSLRNLGGHWQIWSQHSDGSGARALVSQGMPDVAYDLVVAANGQMVFGGGGNATVWRANADGSGLGKLLDPPPGAQDFAPAIVRPGSNVSFMQVDAQGDQSLQTVPLAGGTPSRAWSGFIFAGSGAASPDGTRVFVVARGPTPGSHVAQIVRLAPLDGSGQPQATPVPLDRATMPGPWRWTADGKAIVFCRSQGSVDNLMALPIAGGNPVPLTHFTDLNIGDYSFFRDGRLAVSRGSQNSDAVLATGLRGSYGH